MAIYQTPNASDMQDIGTIFTWINNTASGGLFFPLVLLAVWVTIFIGSIAEGREVYRGWIYANLVCSILGIILGLLGFLSPAYIYFVIILLGFGLIWAKMARDRG